MENKCDYLYSAFYSQQLNLKQDNIFKIFNASLFAFYYGVLQENNVKRSG